MGTKHENKARVAIYYSLLLFQIFSANKAVVCETVSLQVWRLNESEV